VNCVWDNHSIRTRFGASNVPLSLGLRGFSLKGCWKQIDLTVFFTAASCELRIASYELLATISTVCMRMCRRTERQTDTQANSSSRAKWNS